MPQPIATLLLSSALTCAAASTAADIGVRFIEGAPKDRFEITNLGKCALVATDVVIDLRGSAAGLVFDVTGEAFARTYAISLTPLKGVIKDYLLICDSYYEALRGSSPSQIESVDMGRRGLHNEGAEQLMNRLEGKIAVDQETARRLFTLLCALYRRG